MKWPLGTPAQELSKEAGEMVSELEKSAMSLEDARAKAEGLAAAAAVQGQLKNEDAAKKLLASALEAAQAVERFDSKAYALIAVAKGYARLVIKQKRRKFLKRPMLLRIKLLKPISSRQRLKWFVKQWAK